MTDNFSPRDGSHAASPGSGAGSDSTAAAKTDAAKQQAGDLAQHAKGNAGQVAETAKTEAAGVASEVKSNARDLFTQARSDLTEQAGAQQQKVAEGLRSVADELQSMAQSGQSGVAADLVGEAASRASSVAGWLDGRDPGSLLDEVKGFARQRPMAFLAIAAGAGFLAGRLNKSLSAGVPAQGVSGGSTGQHAAPPVPPAPPIQPPQPRVAETEAEGPGTSPDAAGVDDPFGSEPVRSAGSGPASAQTLPPTPSTGVPAADPYSGGRHS
ncbi:hypothetical protein MUK71_04530 [Arthrobacter zhangbolii]|uniref:ATP synthase F0 subunit B n=1 Tax=Arthrobacter zhangbolii TaxID=2886936 RepID=A0A9X1S993_9MICC|nr:hypothetical protein [Arthrobacter zhangbolii]MCC3272848.1 hypothetical protein [Arthrobacter zhangbolii]UON92914.1 hypothetical protein MUK71_04530 [Arthrobacter zhangbolii]